MLILVLLLISFSPHLPNAVRGALLVIVALAILPRKNQILEARGLLCVVGSLLAVSAAVDALMNQSLEPPSLTAYVMVSFLVGFYVVQRYDLNEYLERFEKVAFWLSALSLVGVALYRFIPAAVFWLPTYEFEGIQHRTVFALNFLIVEDDVVARNAGFTWEPGVLQFVINLGLFAAIGRFNGRVPLIRYCVYALALIATQSTLGLVVFIGLNVLLAVRNRNYRTALVVLGVVLAVPILRTVNYHAAYKLLGSDSFQGRWEPSAAAFSQAVRHPLGIGNIDYQDSAESVSALSYDSYTVIALRYGVPLLVVILLCLFALARKSWPLAAIIAITFAAQSIWFVPVITPFYFYAVTRRRIAVREVHLESSLGHEHSHLQPSGGFKGRKLDARWLALGAVQRHGGRWWPSNSSGFASENERGGRGRQPS